MEADRSASKDSLLPQLGWRRLLTDRSVSKDGPLLDNEVSLRARYVELVDSMLALNAQINERLEILEHKEDEWTSLQEEVSRNMQAAKSKINLNVGGRVFATTKSTLLRWEGTFFQALLGSGQWQPMEDGAYFIDRNPVIFERIIEAMRCGDAVETEGLTGKQIHKLAEECDYFQLPNEAPAPMSSRRGPLKWDALRCHRSLSLSSASRVVTKGSGGGGWKAAMASRPGIASFKIRILTFGSLGDVMVGYAKRDMSADGPNYHDKGWFLQCGLGSLWSPNDSGRAYCEPLRIGDVLEVCFDAETSQICFLGQSGQHLGAHLGIAFSGIDVGDYPPFPCVELWGDGASVAIEE